MKATIVAFMFFLNQFEQLFLSTTFQMILIFSNVLDHSTNEICNLLLRSEVPFIRVNNYSFYHELTISVSNNSEQKIEFKGIDLLKEVSCVWYRREPSYEEDLSEYPPGSHANITNILYREIEVIKNFLIDSLKNVFWLSHPNNASMNKLVVLQQAANVGLRIPMSKSSGKVNVLKEFHDQSQSIITKPLFEAYSITNEKVTWSTRTEVVTQDIYENFDETLYPSFLQENIAKEVEIRTVFLEGKFYSMIIHSQKNEKTSTDFRFFNTGNPNRFAGYKLPEVMEDKISNLMKNMNLNFGSLDFIIDKNGNYIFLEINPVGQFGMTSTPNNYGIEKDVSKILIREYGKNSKRKK